MTSIFLLFLLVPLCFSQYSIPVKTINSHFVGVVTTANEIVQITGVFHYDSRMMNNRPMMVHETIRNNEGEETNELWQFTDSDTYATTYYFANGKCTNETERNTEVSWPVCSGWVENQGFKSQSCKMIDRDAVTDLTLTVFFFQRGYSDGASMEGGTLRKRGDNDNGCVVYVDGTVGGTTGSQRV